MKNELSLYVDEEKIEETDSVEMQLYAQLQGLTSSQENIDKPADKSLKESVSKASDGEERTVPAPSVSPKQSASRRTGSGEWTVTDFILLVIAALLFLNFVTK